MYKTGLALVVAFLTYSISVAQQVSSNAAVGTIIWQSDFSTDSIWELDSLNGFYGGWQIGTQVPQGGASIAGINSSTKNNGFALFDSDYLCNELQEAILGVDSAIDCSQKQNCVLEFQQFYRKYQGETYVDFSTDGINYTEFEVNATLNQGEFTPNAQTIQIDVSTLADGASTFYFRFRYRSLKGITGPSAGCDYAWMIDDVRFYERAANNLLLNQVAYTDSFTDSYTRLYTKIPASQVVNHKLKLSAAVKNIGTQTQQNAVFVASFSGAKGGSLNSIPKLVEVDSTAYLTTNGFFQQTASVGVQTIKTSIYNYPIPDADSSNNELVHSYEISPNIYSFTNGTSNAVWSILNQQSFIGQRFDFYATDTVASIGVDLNYETVGAQVKVSIYNLDSLVNPLYESFWYTIDSNKVGDYYYMPLNSAVLKPGRYVAGVWSSSNLGVKGNLYSSNEAPSFYTIYNTDSIWYYTQQRDVNVQLKLKNQSLCTGVKIYSSALVYDNNPLGRIQLKVDSGGVAPYVFNWGGPNGYESAVQNPNDLPAKGRYTVTITDINGCSDTNAFTLFGIVGLNEVLQLTNNYTVYPNPATETLRIDNVKGDITKINIYSNEGKLIHTGNWSRVTNNSIELNVSSLKYGSYVCVLYLEYSDQPISLPFVKQ